MIRIVQYISARIESFRWFKFNISKANTQEVRVVGPFGIDAVPVKDMMAVFANTKMKGKGIIFGILNTNNSAAEGEVRLYSLNADLDEQTYLHIKVDGTIEIGGVGDFAVRYSKLEEAFNQLKDDYDSHIHVTTATISSGGAGVIQPVAVGSTADISDAKVDEVKLPS